MILYDFDPKWVADRIPYVDDFGPCAALGVESQGRVLAGVVYSDYAPEFKTIQVSVASVSPMWARKENLRELLAYPFIQLGCNLVWTSTPLFNQRALKVNRHIGFEFEAILFHRYGRDRHADIARMLSSDYHRIYGVGHGEKRSLATAGT